ncbi:MAG: A/G-specific adenine glycosylase [Bdellovibrionia bacterium]
MNANNKLTLALQAMDKWFDRQKRVLPWRNDPSFYRVWVSEIMLQQTQVVTVIPYFERFVARFPTVQSLAEAPLEDVLLLWSGLGYYSRARNLHRGAQEIVKNQEFPKTRESWLAIPGVGNYTAGAILSIADNQPEAILDGNVERVISRLRKVSREKGESLYKATLWTISKDLVELGHEHRICPSNLNQALMELGATVCIPRNPRCLLCPLTEICEAYKSQEQGSYPPKKKPKEWIIVEENLHCFVNETGEVLLRRRGSGEWRAGLWDLLEQKPQNLKVKPFLLGEIESRHIVTRHKIKRSTQIWRVKNVSGSEDLRWVPLKNPNLPMGSALKKTIQKVLVEFPGILSS